MHPGRQVKKSDENFLVGPTDRKNGQRRNDRSKFLFRQSEPLTVWVDVETDYESQLTTTLSHGHGCEPLF